MSNLYIVRRDERINRQRRFSTQNALACVLCATSIASQAHADVFEINANGHVRRIDQAPEASQTSISSTTPFMDAFRDAAARHDISVDLLISVARAESNFNADAVSSAGAIGVMQLMPETARQLGVDPRDPAQNIMGGAAYLRHLLDRFEGRVDLALAAYNAGPGAIARYGDITPYRETRAYVGRNLDLLANRSLVTEEGTNQ